MIKIEADTKKTGKNEVAEVIIKIDTDSEKTATKELFAILKSLDEKHPKILMGAVDMHIIDMIVDEEVDDHD